MVHPILRSVIPIFYLIVVSNIVLGQSSPTIEQGFAIYRSSSPTEGFVLIGTVPSNITDYTDNSVDPATTYYYKVLAFNSSGSSSFSNTIAATTFAKDESDFKGALRLWCDNSPIAYNNQKKDSTLITNIFVHDNSGNRLSDTALQPDGSGNFEFNMGNGNAIQIERDIPGVADMMPVINGIDVQMVRKVLVQDITFIPNIYQIIAMDVNMDGIISAGDVTQMNQRAMSQSNEYQQAWNYDSQGVSSGVPSKDWLFIPGRMLSGDENFRISATYPSDDHMGYSKYRVPVLPNSLPLPVKDSIYGPQVTSEIYQGILLGDVDGNYKRISNIPILKSTAQQTAGQVVLDISSAQVHAGFMDIPISIVSDSPVYSLDFAMRIDEEKIKFESVVNPAESLQYQVYYDHKAKTLRLTSNSLQQFDADKSLFSLRFAINTGLLNPSDILSSTVYLNGEPVAFKVNDNSAAIPGEEVMEDINIYPNPASSFLFIDAPPKATVQFLAITGNHVNVKSGIVDETKYVMDIQHLHNGMYLIKIQYGKHTSVRKVIIAH